MRFVMRNWKTFQHYKNRTPPWIKLHRTLLHNREWRAASDFARALLPELWLLASESQDGTVTGTPDALAWRLRYPKQRTLDIAKAIDELSNLDFIDLDENASKVLASCLQGASAEGEEVLRSTSTTTTIPSGSKRVSRKLIEIPDSWVPNGAHQTKATELHVDLADQASRFRNHHEAKGNRFKDWDKAFHGWLSNSPSFVRNGKGQTNGTPRGLDIPLPRLGGPDALL